MTQHGVMESVGVLEYLQPTTFQTIAILGVWAVVSVIVIDHLYKKRGE